MLDVKRVRAEPAVVREGIESKGEAADLDRWLELDDEHRRTLSTWEECRAFVNTASKEIGGRKKAGEDASELIAAVSERKGEEKRLKETLDGLALEMDEIYLRIPNLPADDVPRGPDASANVEVDAWGEKRVFDFEPAPHWDLAAGLGVFHPETGGEIAGSGFPLLTGAGARLERGLIQFMLDTHVDEHGCREVSPPFVARREPLVACGQIPKLEPDMYRCQGDDLYLIPTGEVPLTNLHRGEILDAARLPLRYVAATPCFRREAGAAGKDTRGLIRVHQFMKVELMTFARAEDSEAELGILRGHAEAILRKLGLHYRVLLLSTGDMSFAGRRTFDLEVWAPGVGKYLEVSSATTFGDFQARRAMTRYRDGDGKPVYAHTLNGSALALPRTVIAVLETYQRADGTVDVPEALAPYMGGASRITREGVSR